MISRKLATVGAVSILVMAAGVAFGVDHSAKSSVPTGRKSKSANSSKTPPVRVTIPERTSLNGGSSGDPSYFLPPTKGAGTGNSAIPIGNYFEYTPSSQVGNYEFPMYFMNITQSNQDGEFSGTMYLRYADGQNDSVFPFAGVTNPSGSSVAITVTGQPTKVIYNGQLAYVAAVVAPVQRLVATVTNRVITMNQCDTYLHFLTPAGGAPPNEMTRDPNICNFYYIGDENFPNRSQIPIQEAYQD